MKGKETFMADMQADILQLVQGEALPWQKTWQRVPWVFPFNAKTGHYYAGQNLARLFVRYLVKGYHSPSYATYRQIADLGGQVRKGEKGTKVLVYRPKLQDEEEAGELGNKPLFYLRVATVFNIEQTEGLEHLIETDDIEREALPELLQAMLDYHKPRIRTGEPCFMPDVQTVFMPPLEKFESEEYYYSTLLHELSHWTMTEDKLNRKLEYAEEELVAEISAFMMCGILGLPFNPRESAAYLQGWQERANGKTREELYQNAFLEAGKVVSYLLEPIQASIDNTAPALAA